MNPEIDYENMTEETLEEWIEFINWLKVPPHLLTKEVREKYKGLMSLKSFLMLEEDLSKINMERGINGITSYLIPTGISYNRIASYTVIFSIHEDNLQLKYFPLFFRYVKKVTNCEEEEIDEAIREVIRRFSVPVDNIDKLTISQLSFRNYI